VFFLFLVSISFISHLYYFLVLILVLVCFSGLSGSIFRFF
jgi:hypothetical protein